MQQTVERLQPEFSPQDIFIATGKRYEEIVKKQLPQIKPENFIFEPEMRDVGPAIGLVAYALAKKFPDTPMAILWSDHMVKNIDAFKQTLRLAEEKISKKESNFVFIAQKARFANQNMGWIEVGSEIEEKNGVHSYRFKKLLYRPSLEEAKTFFADKNFVWNLGYFVTVPSHLVSLYEKYAPHLSGRLKLLQESWGSKSFEKTLQQHYPTFERTSFDDLILMKMESDGILVISADLGWSDVGAWESLKEALAQTVEENVTKGKVLLETSQDSLLFNYTDQLIVGIDLDQMLVINTKDVLLICPKEGVPKIKKLVESLSDSELSHLV